MESLKKKLSPRKWREREEKVKMKDTVIAVIENKWQDGRFF